MKKAQSGPVIVKMPSPPPKGVEPSHCIAVGEGLNLLDIVDYVTKTGTHHVLQLVHPNFDAKMRTAHNLITEPGDFFADPVKVILGNRSLTDSASGDPSGSYIHRTLMRSDEKSGVLDELVTFVSQAPKSKTIGDSVRLIADEFITNAFYNAPVDKSGRRLYADQDRSHVVELKGAECPQFFVTYNETDLMLGIRDPFGSLDVQKLLRHLHKGIQQGAASVLNINESGGAHIGTLLVMDLSVEIYIACRKNVETWMCAVLPLGKSHRTLVTYPKTVHILEMDENGQTRSGFKNNQEKTTKG